MTDLLPPEPFSFDGEPAHHHLEETPMNPLNDYPAIRKALYVIQFVVGLGLGGTQVGYAAADLGQPVWLTVALAVFAFLVAGLGLTAAGNTSTAE